MSCEYGPCIYFISISSESKQELSFLDTATSHRILATVIDMCLKQKLQMTYAAEPFLFMFQRLLINFFLDINKDNIPWKPLIKWFFYHLYVPEFNSKESPMLLKYNNRIFFQIHHESMFPPEILSYVTKQEYPLIFEYVFHKDAFTPDIPCFTKYHCINPEDGQECLLMPEFPIDLRHQIYNFYNLLIDTFPLFDVVNRDEKMEARAVLRYLIRVRDFVDPDPSKPHPNKPH